MNTWLLFLIYVMMGAGMYCALAHYCLQQDNLDPPPSWIIWFWPIIYVLGVVDLIDWIVKEVKKLE